LCGVPHSTLGRAVDASRPRLPTIEVLRPLVRACGASPSAAARWEQAWRRLKAADGGRVRPPVPAQLPPDIPHFAGRATELAVLDRMLDAGATADAPTVTVIRGAAGTGKTALAVHGSHHAA